MKRQDFNGSLLASSGGSFLVSAEEPTGCFLGGSNGFGHRRKLLNHFDVL